MEGKEAIPVEFINEYVKGFRESADEYKSRGIAYRETAEYLNNIAGEIEAMVREWRKEQEENKQEDR